MDLYGLAAQFGYNSLTQNGPQYWAMDILTLNGGEPVNIGGIEMRYGATIPPSNGGIPPYTPFNPEKIQQQPILAGGAENANFDSMHFAPDDKGTILLKTQNRSEGCPTQGNGAMGSCQAEYGPQPVTTVVAVDPDTLDNIDAIALQQGLPDLRKRSWDVRG